MRALLATCFVCLASVAAAQPVVLAIDGADIYVDLGADAGVGAGSELELLHEVVARDPRSGAQLRDRFALGTITVTRSGRGVSVARADDELAKRVAVGDRVRLVSARRKFVDPWEEQVAASRQGPPVVAPPPPVDPGAPPIDHASLARQAWQDTLGQPLDARVERWTRLLADDPQTPYRRAVEAEIASLNDQRARRAAAIDRARTAGTGDRHPRIAELAAQLQLPLPLRRAPLVVGPIERAAPGQPIQLAFLARAPGAIRAAWLYARPRGAAGYTRFPLVRDGDAYLRGTIDGALVTGERLEWYVEVASGADEDSEPVLGSRTEPREIEIAPVVAEAPIARGRTQINAKLDYVDFDGGLDKGYDQYYQAELDFTYRFLDPVYAFRVGFGTLSGKGGPSKVIDEDPRGMCLDESGTYRCQQLTFSYVYTELEVRVRPSVALMLRPQAGLLTTDTMDSEDESRCKGSDIAGCRFLTGFGARGRVRFGDELGTNLVLGIGFTARVGTLLEAAYHWLPHDVVPVQITVQVTDQPVLEDFGVRLIADVGVRKLGWFYPSLRASYQARNIDHAGFSGGLAFNFDW
jgi:hypothetical protein